MFCGKCGLKIKDGETVCHGCGTPTGIAPKNAFNPSSAFRLAGSLDIAADLEGPASVPEKKVSGGSARQKVPADNKNAKILSNLNNDMDTLLSDLAGE